MRENEQLQCKANYNINKGNQAKMSLFSQRQLDNLYMKPYSCHFYRNMCEVAVFTCVQSYYKISSNFIANVSCRFQPRTEIIDVIVNIFRTFNPSVEKILFNQALVFFQVVDVFQRYLTALRCAIQTFLNLKCQKYNIYCFQQIVEYEHYFET